MIRRKDPLPVIDAKMRSFSQSFLQQRLEGFDWFWCDYMWGQQIVNNRKPESASLQHIGSEPWFTKLTLVAAHWQDRRNSSCSRRRCEGEQNLNLIRNASERDTVQESKHSHVTAARQRCQRINGQSLIFCQSQFAKQPPLNPIDWCQNKFRCMVIPRRAGLHIRQICDLYKPKKV